jgi:hypothetical protein
MALDSITKKRQLEYVVPDSLPSNLTSLPSPTTSSNYVSNPQSVLTNLVQSYQSEINEWNTLIQNTPQSSTYSVPTQLQDYLGSTNYSSNDLPGWLNTGNTAWPDIITSYEDSQWNSPNSSIQGMLYGVVLEVANELQSALYSLQGYVGSGSTLPTQISSVYNYKLISAQTLRDKINQAILDASQRLAGCYIQKFAGILNNNNSIGNLQTFVKSARAILQYSSINQKVNWTATRTNLVNRFLQLLAEKALLELSSNLIQLESSVTSPLTSIISNISSLINQNTCDSFSELIGLLQQQNYQLRYDAASKLLELQKEIDKKFSLRGSMVQLASSKVNTNKHLQALETLLAALDNVFSSGRLDTQLLNFYKKQETTAISGTLVSI